MLTEDEKKMLEKIIKDNPPSKKLQQKLQEYAERLLTGIVNSEEKHESSS